MTDRMVTLSLPEKLVKWLAEEAHTQSRAGTYYARNPYKDKWARLRDELDKTQAQPQCCERTHTDDCPGLAL